MKPLEKVKWIHTRAAQRPFVLILLTRSEKGGHQTQRLQARRKNRSWIDIWGHLFAGVSIAWISGRGGVLKGAANDHPIILSGSSLPTRQWLPPARNLWRPNICKYPTNSPLLHTATTANWHWCRDAHKCTELSRWNSCCFFDQNCPICAQTCKHYQLTFW